MRGKPGFYRIQLQKIMLLKTTLKQPFMYDQISNLITEHVNCNKSYMLYIKDVGGESFDEVVYLDNFWRSWHRNSFF